MTDKQVQLYGRRWSAVCHSNDWRMGKGRLVPEARLNDSAWHTQVRVLAQQHAQQNSRSMNVEDLRRGMVHLITGQFCSSKDMTNQQFDRWLTLAKLLIDPDDLDAVLIWDNPKLGEIERLKWSIEHSAPDNYVRTIAADRFGTRLWEDLDLPELKQLAMTVRARSHAKAAKAAKETNLCALSDLSVSPEGDPF